MELYEPILSTIQEWGEKLIESAGRVADIGVKKRWLTEFDLAIERAVAETILALPGEHVLFAEEEHQSAPVGESIWILDPVSSTKSFIRGVPLFSTVISHVVNGETRFAAVFDPSRRELFTARRGQGAYLAERRLQVDASPSDWFLHSMPAHRSLEGEPSVSLYADLLKLGSVRMSGMSEGLAYAYVACGRFSGAVGGNIDVFPAWAGRLLVEEAGGLFTDFFGQPLTFDPHGTACGPAAVHARLVSTVSRYGY
jgi:myo-inositol-1(or 4)-monophosphatase